jgi:hypothetical protein
MPRAADSLAVKAILGNSFHGVFRPFQVLEAGGVLPYPKQALTEIELGQWALRFDFSSSEEALLCLLVGVAYRHPPHAVHKLAQACGKVRERRGPRSGSRSWLPRAGLSWLAR